MSKSTDRKLSVSSPCVGICALDEQDICVGCHRTGLEIAYWGSMTDKEREDVMKLVAVREQSALL